VEEADDDRDLARNSLCKILNDAAALLLERSDQLEAKFDRDDDRARPVQMLADLTREMNEASEVEREFQSRRSDHR